MNTPGKPSPSPNRASAKESSSARVPTSVRLAFEIPKPKDWPAFQRNCVVLFREELRDPHTMEYGRNGQKQHGIDIKACRNGDPKHVVGIQCRRYKKKLKYQDMLADCRAAAKQFQNLREFIFATTSPDDADLTDQVARIEEQLSKEGFSIRVVLYGWDALQQVIVRHNEAYDLFSPNRQVIREPKVDLAQALMEASEEAIFDRFADQIARRMQVTGLQMPRSEPENLPDNATSEDPALHGRIDVYRDLLVRDAEPGMARKGLLDLRADPSLDAKPWARYRIEANLAAVEYHLGNEDAAVALFEAAYALRPNDPTAKAHLSLAKLIKESYAEALSLAREALAGSPHSEQALTCLIQASVRSGSTDDVDALIPEAMRGTVGADLGLAEACRHLKEPGWETRCIEIAKRHPNAREFIPISALAILSLVVDSEMVLPGGVGPVSGEDIAKAADDMFAFAGHLIDIGYADQQNLRAHLNNASVLLRICGRTPDAEALLKRAPSFALEDPTLRLQLAVAVATQGRESEAIELLDGDLDPENRIFRLHLLSSRDPQATLDGVLEVDTDGLRPRLAWMRSNLIAEMGLKTGRLDVVPDAISALRAADAADPAPAVLELRMRRLQGLEQAEFNKDMIQVAQGLSDHAPMSHRCFLAVELRDAGLAGEASRLLDDHIDLQRPYPTAVFYLRCLAEARRDEVFCKALDRSAQSLRDLPEVLWATAAHAWNMGDLPRAEEATGRLVEIEPHNLAARLFKIQVFLRRNKISLVEAEVREPLETMASKRLEDFTEVVALFVHFDLVERAATLAYRLFLENRDNPNAWMTLVKVVLGEGQKAERDDALWTARAVGPDMAVDIKYEDGEERFFVIEPDPSVRKLDGDAWEPHHSLIRSLTGLSVGDEFTDPNGRKGKINQIRHKVVARFHYILDHYELRFPEQQGFRSIRMDPDHPDGMADMIAVLKARVGWATEELEQYRRGNSPLALLAARLGTDVIEAAEGLAAQGIKLKASEGSHQDRHAAEIAILSNKRRGVVLDLLSFWTAWRLDLLRIIEGAVGRIHVGQRIVDRLRNRRDLLALGGAAGTAYIVYDNGQPIIRETPADVVLARRDELQKAIEWLETHAVVCPLVASDDLPQEIRRHLGMARTDLFDALVLAKSRNLLLSTDDLAVRKLGSSIGFSACCWTQAILSHARSRHLMSYEHYVRSIAALIGAGHDYISITSLDLLHALLADAQDGQSPGPVFRQLSGNIGGPNAEPLSHRDVVSEFLELAWSDEVFGASRQEAGSILLRQLIRSRHDDYGILLRHIFTLSLQQPDLRQFLRYWQRGHFITDEAIFGRVVID